MKEELSFYEVEIKSILGLPPSWLIWSGSYLIIGLLVLFICLGFFWQHPEVYTVATHNVESTDLSPLALPEGAILDTILVADRQLVEAGEVLLLYRKGALREALSSPEAGQIFWLGNTPDVAPLGLRPDRDPLRLNVSVAKQHLAMLKLGQKVALRGTGSPTVFGHIEHFTPLLNSFNVQIKTEKPSPLTAFSVDLELSFILNEKPIFLKLLND